MMDPQLTSELQTIQDMISLGHAESARQSLLILRRQYPDEPAIWWYLGQTYETADTDVLRKCLLKVINTASKQPHARHWSDMARARLTELLTYSATQISISDSNYRRTSRKGLWKIKIAVVLVVIAAIAVGTVVHVTKTKKEPSVRLVGTPPAESGPAAVFSTPTPTSVVAFLSTQASMLVPPVSTTIVFTATAAQIDAPTPAALASATPLTISALITLEPNGAMRTYWESELSGPNRARETLARFYEFPVKIYLTSNDPFWLTEVYHAIGHISPYVPMTLIDNAAESDIFIHILSPAEYSRLSACSTDELLVGCGMLVVIQNEEQGLQTYSYQLRGDVWLLDNSNNASGNLLHELLHALGIRAHSTDPRDIMYPVETHNTQLTEQDISALQLLYPPSFTGVPMPSE